MLECCHASLLGLPEAGSELVEVVDFGKVLDGVVNENVKNYGEDNAK